MKWHAPPDALVQMGPVEQRESHLHVTQPALPAGPRSTGDEPEGRSAAAAHPAIDPPITPTRMPVAP